jgi:hypothetical protein
MSMPPKIKGKVKTSKLPINENINNLPLQPFWNIRHYTFLEAYRETLDEKEAANTAGLNIKELRILLLDPKVKAAMEDAKDDFVAALKLTKKKGARKFLEVYKKIEDSFDNGEVKVAGALANMAATFLKATGQLGDNKDRKVPNVSININLDCKKSGHNEIDNKIINVNVSKENNE